MKLQRKHIESEWDEGHPDSGGDGYWIALKNGYCWDGDPCGAVHTIHEGTRREAYAQTIRICRCKDCEAAQ